MKKLKVVMTLLLVLCCSLCMFACGGAKNVRNVDVEGQKLSFKEGEEFSLGDNVKVTAYYQGDDDGHELKPSDYEVDSSAYKKDLAGQYIIYIIPKNQPKELWDGTAEGKDSRYKKSYYVSVDHSWHASEDPAYQQECDCGAKMNSYTGLEDKITTVAWGQPAVLEKGPEGKTYPDAKAPIAGENHVSYGSLVKGQSLKLHIEITGLTRAETPGAASAWDTPLLGIRNAGVGMLPREDGWVIATAAGFALPATSNIPSGGSSPATGTATTEDSEWTVYGSGTTWSAGTAFPNDNAKPTAWSTIDAEFNYQADGIFLIRHTLNKFDGTKSEYIVTTKVPEAAYEIAVYGEYCNFNVTGAEFVAGRAIETYKITSEPANLVQPAGKIFDTTGLDTLATFSDGGELKGSYNAYAYRDITPEATKDEPTPAPVKTRVNLATEPLQPDFYDFMVEFNGKQAWLTKDGNESTDANKADNQKIRVVATPVVGANTSAITVNDVSFEAPESAYDYAVTDVKNFSASYIRLCATGSAVKATDAQKAVLGSEYTHFVAFKLVTNLTDLAVSAPATAPQGVVVKATAAGSTVDVVLGLKSGYAKTFDLTLKEGAKVRIDLSGLNALSNYGAEIVGTPTFTLDAGGEYVVKYTGLGSEAEIKALKLPLLAKNSTVEQIQADLAKGTEYAGSKNLKITKVEIGANSLTVTYWLGAPDLGNLTASNSTTKVLLRDGKDNDITSASLTYRLAVSKEAIAIGENVFIKSSNNKLQVYTFTTSNNVADGWNFAASLNIENETANSYNVGISVKEGAASWLDLNDLTGHTSSAAKLIVFGTANDATDYDKGAILVANLHLPALGLREGSKNREQLYHFTVNEDPDHPAETYTVYTVGGGEDSDAIASAQQAVTGLKLRENIVQFTCLQDGRNAYELNYQVGGESKVFLFGAVAVKAPGVHEWASEGDDRNCTRCGAHYMKFTDGNTVRELTDLPTITRVANPDTDKDNWWASPTEDVPVTGDFVVRYSWTNIDPNFPGDGAVELHDGNGNYFGYRTFAADYNPGPDTSKLCGGAGTDKTVFKKGTETVEGGIWGDNAPAGVPAEDWQGEAYVTVYRYGTTLVIDAHLTLADGKTTYQVTTTLTNFTTGDLYLHINGNHYWCDKLMIGIGSATTTTTTAESKTVVTTGDLGVTLGKTDNSAPYTGSTPLWTLEQEFKPGMRVEVGGEHTASGANAWNSVLAYLDADLNFRADNWVNGAADGQGESASVPAMNLSVAKVWKGMTPASLNDPDWVASWKLLAATKTQATIVWDWTEASKIVITYKFAGTLDGEATEFNQEYVVTSTASFAASYKIGLGVDGAWFKMSKLVVTEPIA